MYKIFHNHETGVITIGETIPEGARIQCLDLATAQNTVRALNAVEALAEAVDHLFASTVEHDEDPEPLAEWERELLAAQEHIPMLCTLGDSRKLYLRVPGTKDFFDVHQNLADPAVEKIALAPVDAAALATLRQTIEGGERTQNVEAAARWLLSRTAELGLVQ